MLHERTGGGTAVERAQLGILEDGTGLRIGIVAADHPLRAHETGARGHTIVVDCHFGRILAHAQPCTRSGPPCTIRGLDGFGGTRGMLDRRPPSLPERSIPSLAGRAAHLGTEVAIDTLAQDVGVSGLSDPTQVIVEMRLGRIVEHDVSFQ